MSEVCIIGAGLAGLTTARELALRGWSVAVIEARRIAWNASGRNTGFVLPGFAQDMDAVVAPGRTRARQAAVGVVRGRGRICPRDDPRDSRCPASAWSRRLAQGVARAMPPRRSGPGSPARAGLRRCGRGLADRARARGAADRPLFSRRPFPDSVSYSSAQLCAWTCGCRRAAGVRIFEDTPAVSIDAAGVRKWVVTPSGRLRAAHIVLAGNVHLGALLPRVSGTLLPVGPTWRRRRRWTRGSTTPSAIAAP